MYIIAMLTMLIDHIGIVFAPDEPSFLIIGRPAMPIYSYCLVQGYLNTRSKKLYILRLMVIALISQIPFIVALHQLRINIVGTFIVCFLVLWCFDKLKSKVAAVGASIIGLVVLEALPFDYGSYALLLILAYKYLKSHPLVAVHLIINLVFWYYKGSFLQIFSLIPTVVFVYWPAFFGLLDRVKVNRWIWRSFYPVHLIALAVVHYFY